MRTAIAVLLACVASAVQAFGCTAFCASNDKMVLVGNNEDDNNPFTRVWFMPGGNGKAARMYVGFDNLWPQGGMNERGLWFDGFATAPIEATHSAAKPGPPPYFLDTVMTECASVRCVIDLFGRYNLAFLRKGVLMFADASGDSVIIEPDAVIRKKGRYQVQTNFHQSLPKPEYECGRFRVATRMLHDAGDNISVDLFRRILAAAHSESEYPTVYSNVYDLKRRVMYLYHFHNYEKVVTLDMAAELKKGTRVLDIAALFPKNEAAEGYSRRRAKELNRAERTAIRLDPKLLDEYVGKYSLEGVSTVTITREGSRLTADAEALPRLELLAETPTNFFVNLMDVQLAFVRGGDGKVDGIVVRQEGRTMQARRVR